MNSLTQKMMEIFHQTKKITLDDHGNDWAYLAVFGKNLVANGIDFKKEGYPQLKSFIEANKDLFTMYKDDTKNPPVFYVRLKNDDNKENHPETKKEKNPLLKWAYFPKYRYKELADLARPEKWNWGAEKYAILMKYIVGTFIKLQKESKIYYTKDGKYAVFNTGLPDKYYEPIYAIFIKNEYEDQKWKLDGFSTAGSGIGKPILGSLAEKPKAASYFTKGSDRLYDVTKGEPTLDYDHILLQRVYRFPQRVKNAIGYDVQSYNANADSYKHLRSLLDQAVKIAVRQIQFRYKAEIPVYHREKDRMCLLLPLSLLGDDIVDVALVVSKNKDEAEGYQGETIYTLDWAYENARIVSRLDNNWLVPEQTPEDLIEENEDE